MRATLLSVLVFPGWPSPTWCPLRHRGLCNLAHVEGFILEEADLFSLYWLFQTGIQGIKEVRCLTFFPSRSDHRL